MTVKELCAKFPGNHHLSVVISGDPKDSTIKTLCQRGVNNSLISDQTVLDWKYTNWGLEIIISADIENCKHDYKVVATKSSGGYSTKVEYQLACTKCGDSYWT